MWLANLIHALRAVLWLAIAPGHRYPGTTGTLRGTGKGTVSKVWMQPQHKFCYEPLLRGTAQAQQHDSGNPRSRPGAEPSPR
jgi:formate dehydrogenase subunit gamma